MADFSDNFRPEFKRYKRKFPPPCLKDVLDTEIEGHERVLYRLELSQVAQGQDYQNSVLSEATRFGLQNPNTWQCYGAHGYPGFQFIRNPFSPGAQRYWVRRCMADYPCKPNLTNLDTQYKEDELADPWQDSRKKFSPSSKTASMEKTLMDQLRWVTLGYHYDWNNKVYNQDHHSPFPDDLGQMSALIARMLGYPSFQSQAAIVNFYHMDSTLGGHTDHSEFDLTAPLISYSLGQSAILLVGGKTKATKPLSLHLRSGDVVILGGESRLAYHAVPKIMYAHYEKGRLPHCLGSSEVQQQSEACQESVEDGNHLPIAVIGTQCSIINNECGTQTNPERYCNSGPFGKSLESDTALARKVTSDSHSKHFCGHLNQEPQYKSQDNCLNRTTLGNTVTSLSLSKRTQDGEPDTVSGNISSAMKDLSRDDQWRDFEQYLKHARINISVRQVTGPGKGFPQRESCHEESDRAVLATSNTKRTKMDES